MQINGLLPDDTGMFQCFARNLAGEIQTNTYLAVTSTYPPHMLLPLAPPFLPLHFRIVHLLPYLTRPHLSLYKYTDLSAAFMKRERGRRINLGRRAREKETGVSMGVGARERDKEGERGLSEAEGRETQRIP